MSLTVREAPARAPAPAPRPARRAQRRTSSLLAHGEPMVWLTGGSLTIALLMIGGLLALVLAQGLATFWPRPLVAFETTAGATLLGEVSKAESYAPPEGELVGLDEEAAARVREGGARRRLVRTGNYDLTGNHFQWLSDLVLVRETRPEWALVVERLTWGRFYGTPQSFRLDGAAVTEEPGRAWELYVREHDAARERHERARALEKRDLGRLNRRLEALRIERNAAALEDGADSPAWRLADEALRRAEREFAVERERILEQVRALDAENARYELVLRTADGQEKALGLHEIVRAYPANRLSLAGKLRVYLSRWWEFLSAEPREANSEGGVLPAIFGTVAMTLVMSVIVVPFGVLAALYLREYARQGAIVSAVRIAVNNLAGVPSIVFGVFGLGFFCYIVGGGIDRAWFAAKLPAPTFGTGGILWASLTLALLTLPVVIVATEEALSAVPNSMREGSYACGATKWQTIRRIVLPHAAPGIMTGMILAIARGAGEVAPLMLVGAVKLAPELPIDGVPPFLHPERSFMHLGFHIFDLGFQSPNSEAAKPMVYTTTLLLIAIVVTLNAMSIWVRARLRRRFQTVHA